MKKTAAYWLFLSVIKTICGQPPLPLVVTTWPDTGTAATMRGMKTELN